MMLCDLPDDCLKVGTRVWNYFKTKQGTIKLARPHPRDGGMDVLIVWDDSTEQDHKSSFGWVPELKLELVYERDIEG